MKLLFDENFSYRLVEAVEDLFPGSVHVSQVGLTRGTPDLQIWNYAKQNGFAVITGDTDFVTFANTLGPPPKVVLLERCDYPFREAVRLLRINAIRFSEFAADSNSLLILRKQ